MNQFEISDYNSAKPINRSYDINFLNENSSVPNLGSGDTSLLLNILSSNLAGKSFDKLIEEVQWTEMMHKGGPVPRRIAIQGLIVNGFSPIYRHPADEQPMIQAWTPTVDSIRKEVESSLGLIFNHALIQHYRSGHDYISEHADKTLDITHDYPIINVSIGATRTMVLKSKADHGTSRIVEKVTIPHNSLFILGPKTNRCFLHAIKQDKRLLTEKRPDELIYGGERISLTFRNISTYVRISDGRLFGQGAKCKSLELLEEEEKEDTVPSRRTTSVSHITEDIHMDVLCMSEKSITNNNINDDDNSTHVEVMMTTMNVNMNVKLDEDDNDVNGEFGKQDEEEKEKEEGIKAIISSSQEYGDVTGPNVNRQSASASPSHTSASASPSHTSVSVPSQEEYLTLLKAFSEENRSAHFDWEKSYGKGFDILDFKGII
eukprot:gene6185-12529_t